MSHQVSGSATRAAVVMVGEGSVKPPGIVASEAGGRSGGVPSVEGAMRNPRPSRNERRRGGKPDILSSCPV